MNDKDIAKLATQLMVSLATKEDIQSLKTDIKSLEGKIDDLDQKADTILQFAEAVDETTTLLDRRISKIEAVPIVAHELRIKSKF